MKSNICILNGKPDELIQISKEIEKVADYNSLVQLAIKQMKRQGSMRVINTNEMVKEIFEVTGFADLVKVE